MLYKDKDRTRGRRWMRLKEQVLVAQPVCNVCQRVPSVEVDHIHPVSKGGDDSFDNLQGICGDCHEDKTRKDLGLKKKQIKVGADGYPIVNHK